MFEASIIDCMRSAADIRDAVSEEPLRRDAFQPSLRVMDWTDEPATEGQLNRLRRSGYQPVGPLTKGRAAHLIRNFEEHLQRKHASPDNGVREITKRQAHLLQQAVEEAERAVRDAPEDKAEELRQILGVAVGKRQQFWMDTCRDPPQVRYCSTQVLELFMRYGCRFLVPSCEQVQEILSALDLLMPLWERHRPELFYQTLELNFPELDRLLL
jgi:hypothetical protein